MIGRLLDSSLGQKFVMALTGLLLLGFAFSHLAGNLTLFADAEGETFIAYAKGLHDLGPLLVIAEFGLVALFGVHIAMAYRLTMKNRAARSQPYAYSGTKGQSTVASSSMIYTGTIVLGFLVVHLATMRFAGGLKMMHASDLFDQVRDVFNNPVLNLIYLAGAVALGIHLVHGAKSLFQSLGANHPRLNLLARRFAIAVAVLCALGFAAFPLAGLFGYFKETV